jgi:two-component system, OmpR family, sensor kinase
MRQMSLRARLVLVVLAVTAVGLAASDIATATLLRSYLLGRVDQRLVETGGFAARLLASGVPSGFPAGSLPTGASFPRGDTPDVQAARVDPTGKVVTTVQGPFSPTSDAFQTLPQGPLDRARSGSTVRFETSGSSGRYRGLVEPIPGSGDVAVVISTLRDIDATMRRLYLIEAIATGVLLVVAGALSLRLVRVGLRPLVHIADTADAVAAGEVDRRVDVRGGYEVARLGRALNSAFDARSASEQTLREFISDASHELRTPLTSIRGYAELLRAGALTGEAESIRAASRIEHEAVRMGALVDNLLALARLDEGRPLELSDVDLRALARDAVHDAQVVEPDRPIALIAGPTAHVVADEMRLRQVLANLLSNVREHTPAGTAVEVLVDRTEHGVRIHVIDDGAGIQADACERAFDRFWRGENAHGGPPRGSGLGLAIVSAVATAHGGTAQVAESSRGLRGAHVVVELPHRPSS